MAKTTKKTAFVTPLWKACVNDSNRPFREHIFFIDGYAYACDANILIKQTLTIHNIANPENLNGRALHWMVFKKIMQHPQATATEKGIETPDGCVFPYAEAGTPPNFERVIPAESYYGVEAISQIGINCKELARLGECLGGEVLRLQFCDESRPIRVSVRGSEVDQTAIIMPRAISV